MRIGLTGTHGTGKTTFLNRIEGIPKIKEIARTIIEKTGKLPHEMNDEDKRVFQTELLYEQKNAEDKLKDFITDRTTIDILAYAEDVYDINYEEWIKKHCVGRYDAIFHFPIEFQMEDDGVRKVDEEYRKLIDKRIINLLHRLDLYDKHVEMNVLTGSVNERVVQYNNIINDILNTNKN